MNKCEVPANGFSDERSLSSEEIKKFDEITEETFGAKNTKRTTVLVNLVIIILTLGQLKSVQGLKCSIQNLQHSQTL